MSNSLLFFVAGILFISNHITLGDWFAFRMISKNLDQIFNKLLTINKSLRDNELSFERYLEIDKLEQDIDYSKPKIKIEKGNIEFKNVTFKYDDHQIILKNINLSLKQGESIALIGASGSGKTTLINLLLGIYRISEGEINIDGYNINNIDLNSLRNQMGLVMQETYLFTGTILHNLKMGHRNYDMDNIINACKMANAYDFIMQMPLKFDNDVGVRGNKLSIGQKQRLSIARTILKNPKILILDEPTSSLDIESVRTVQESIRYLMQNRTTIIVSHKLEELTNIDRILVLKKGNIVEQGTHVELMKVNSHYKKLYQKYQKSSY